MSEALRWGILGAGGIAAQFAADLQQNGLTLTAVGSRSQKGADDFAARFGGLTAHASYEQLVSDPEVDVVYVATPHPFHEQNALLAIRAGKHVLVEKSFTVNEQEAASIQREAEQAGVVVVEAMWTRFLPHMVRIREIIAAGTLGDVRTVLADHNQLLPSDPEHRINAPELGGGALLDLGIYPVSFAIDVLGLPTKVLAHASKTATGVDRQTAIIFEHDGGRQSVLHSAIDTLGPTEAVVIGTKASIEIDRNWYEPTTFRVIDSDGAVIEEYDQPVVGRGMQFQAFEFERVVAAGETESPLLPLGESVAIMGVLDEVRRQIGLVYPGE